MENNILDLSPKRSNKFQYMNFAFEISEQLLRYEKNDADKIISRMAINGLHDMLVLAVNEGYIRISSTGLREGNKRYFAQAVFINPDDYHQLIHDIGMLQGGNEILKRYFT